MTRDEWRRLCEKTPKGNSGQPRWFHQSTFFGVREGVLVRYPGHTYRKKVGPNVGYG